MKRFSVGNRETVSRIPRPVKVAHKGKYNPAHITIEKAVVLDNPQALREIIKEDEPAQNTTLNELATCGSLTNRPELFGNHSFNKEPVSPAVRLKEIAIEQEIIVSKTGFAEIKRMNELGYEIVGIQSSLSWFACRLEKMKKECINNMVFESKHDTNFIKGHRVGLKVAVTYIDSLLEEVK